MKKLARRHSDSDSDGDGDGEDCGDETGGCDNTTGGDGDGGDPGDRNPPPRPPSGH